jgi:hypothetical protein
LWDEIPVLKNDPVPVYIIERLVRRAAEEEECDFQVLIASWLPIVPYDPLIFSSEIHPMPDRKASSPILHPAENDGKIPNL